MHNPLTATSVTRIEAPLRDIPKTVNVVPREVIRDQVTIRSFSAVGDQFIDGLRDDALYFRDLSTM